MKHDIVRRLLAQGYSKSAKGSREFWRAYDREYEKLPVSRERAKRKREAAKRKECLTPAQLNVARGILLHKKNAEIASDMGLRPRTVVYHLTALYKRSRVTSREQFIALWTIKSLPPRIQAQLPEPPTRYREWSEGDALPVGRRA